MRTDRKNIYLTRDYNLHFPAFQDVTKKHVKGRPEGSRTVATTIQVEKKKTSSFSKIIRVVV